MTYRPTQQKRSRFKSFSEIIAELKKVVWLPRREVAYLTSLVLIVTAIFGALLGTLDFAFAQVAKFLVGG